MPIHPKFRKYYRTPAWIEARAAIIERAGNRCEICGKPNRTFVHTLPLGIWFDPRGDDWSDSRGQEVSKETWDLARMRARQVGRWLCTYEQRLSDSDLFMEATVVIRVVLTVAHLDHNPRHNNHDNLKALCQRCHLVHDLPHHRQSRRINRDERTGQIRIDYAGDRQIEFPFPTEDDE